MIIFFILICLIVGWAIFDNESGCLQVGLFCAAVIIVILLCFYFQRVYQSPEYEKKQPATHLMVLYINSLIPSTVAQTS